MLSQKQSQIIHHILYNPNFNSMLDILHNRPSKNHTYLKMNLTTEDITSKIINKLLLKTNINDIPLKTSDTLIKLLTKVNYKLLLNKTNEVLRFFAPLIDIDVDSINAIYQDINTPTYFFTALAIYYKCIYKGNDLPSIIDTTFNYISELPSQFSYYNLINITDLQRNIIRLKTELNIPNIPHIMMKNQMLIHKKYMIKSNIKLPKELLLFEQIIGCEHYDIYMYGNAIFVMEFDKNLFKIIHKLYQKKPNIELINKWINTIKNSLYLTINQKIYSIYTLEMTLYDK